VTTYDRQGLLRVYITHERPNWETAAIAEIGTVTANKEQKHITIKWYQQRAYGMPALRQIDRCCHGYVYMCRVTMETNLWRSMPAHSPHDSRTYCYYHHIPRRGTAYTSSGPDHSTIDYDMRNKVPGYRADYTDLWVKCTQTRGETCSE
jgi:hypothetical protein